MHVQGCNMPSYEQKHPIRLNAVRQVCSQAWPAGAESAAQRVGWRGAGLSWRRGAAHRAAQSREHHANARSGEEYYLRRGREEPGQRSLRALFWGRGKARSARAVDSVARRTCEPFARACGA